MIYRFRIISDESEQFIRCIDIDHHASLEELNNAILDSVGFERGNMSSFFETNDEWECLQEITLMDMSDEDSDQPVMLMSDTPINSIIHKEGEKLVFVFDFFSDRAFYITLTEVRDKDLKIKYPFLSASNGEPPLQFMVDDELESLMSQITIPNIADISDSKDSFSDPMDDDMSSHENLDDYLDRM